MYRTNSGRSFKSFKVYYNDVNYVVIKEEYPEDFEDELNGTIADLKDQGFTITDITTTVFDFAYTSIIEYASEENIYWEKKEVEQDG